jgi:hypothetical protein
MTTPRATKSARVRVRNLFVVAMAGLIVGIGSFAIVSAVTTPRRTTPVYDPPVLAGQQIPGFCSGGFYARHGDSIVLTTTPHCASEGWVAHDPGGMLLGVFGPTAKDATCAYPGHTCAASDVNYLIVAPERIPWGHLNEVDLGTGGYAIIPPGTKPLACGDIAIGDPVEFDGRGIYRSGTVIQKGENLKPPAADGSYFPCMVISSARVDGGDSGAAVLVRGIPAGITSRSFGGSLGFTPLAEGLAELGLDLCTDPNCGLVPPGGSQ